MEVEVWEALGTATGEHKPEPTEKPERSVYGSCEAAETAEKPRVQGRIGWGPARTRRMWRWRSGKPWGRRRGSISLSRRRSRRDRCTGHARQRRLPRSRGSKGGGRGYPKAMVPQRRGYLSLQGRVVFHPCVLPVRVHLCVLVRLVLVHPVRHDLGRFRDVLRVAEGVAPRLMSGCSVTSTVSVLPSVPRAVSLPGRSERRWCFL